MEASVGVLPSFETREYISIEPQGSQELLLDEPEDPLGIAGGPESWNGAEPVNTDEGGHEYANGPLELEAGVETEPVAGPVIAIGSEAVWAAMSVPQAPPAVEPDGSVRQMDWSPIAEEPLSVVGIALHEEAPIAASVPAVVSREEPSAPVVPMQAQEAPVTPASAAVPAEELIAHTAVNVAPKVPAARHEPQAGAAVTVASEPFVSVRPIEVRAEDIPKTPAAALSATEQKPPRSPEASDEQSAAASNEEASPVKQEKTEDSSEKKDDGKKPEAAKAKKTAAARPSAASELVRFEKRAHAKAPVAVLTPAAPDMMPQRIDAAPKAGGASVSTANEPARPLAVPEVTHVVELRRDVKVQEVVVFVKRQVEQTIAVARNKPAAVASVKAAAKRVVSRSAAPFRPNTVIYRSAPAPAHAAVRGGGPSAPARPVKKVKAAPVEMQIDTVEELIVDLMDKLDKQVANDPDTYDTLHKLRRRIAALQDLAKTLRLHLGRRAITALKTPAPRLAFY